MKLRRVAAVISAFFIMTSLNAIAQDSAESREPVYDCTVDETKLYIEQVTHNVFAPSTLPTPSEFNKAYVEAAVAKAAAGDEDGSTCASIFTDGTLDVDWQEIVDAIRDLDFDINFSGIDAAMLQALLDKAKEKVREKATEALTKLGEDVCAMISTDNIKEVLLDAANKRYGTRARTLRLESFADELRDREYDNADDNVKMLLSEDEMSQEYDSRTADELKTIRKTMWDKFH
jgi:hypothetical protein